MVFQIVDDVLDLTATEAELGKPAGHDIEEGVYTLPVIATLASGSSDANELRGLLGGTLDREQWHRALEIVRTGPGIAAAVEVAAGYAAAARAALGDLPECAAASALCHAPQALLATLKRS
jgi:heptaprenyl diphosphate synthase